MSNSVLSSSIQGHQQETGVWWWLTFRVTSVHEPEIFAHCFTDNLLKNKISGKDILLLDGHRAHCSSPLIIQTADKITLLSLIHRVFVLITYSLCKIVVWTLRVFFQNTKLQHVKSLDIAWRASLGLLGVTLLSWALMYVLLSQRVFILSTATEICSLF